MKRQENLPPKPTAGLHWRFWHSLVIFFFIISYTMFITVERHITVDRHTTFINILYKRFSVPLIVTVWYVFVVVPSGSLSLLKNDAYFKLKLLAMFSPLLPAGFGSVPLFNQRKRNRVPLTSAPSENEFFFHSECMASTSSATSASTASKCWMKWKLTTETGAVCDRKSAKIT